MAGEKKANMATYSKEMYGSWESLDEVPGTSHGTKMRPHEANIQPGALFSYVPLVGPAYGHFKDRWLVLEVSEPSVQAGIGATYSITAVNQWGRLTRMNLLPTDRIVVLSEAG